MSRRSCNPAPPLLSGWSQTFLYRLYTYLVAQLQLHTHTPPGTPHLVTQTRAELAIGGNPLVLNSDSDSLASWLLLFSGIFCGSAMFLSKGGRGGGEVVEVD